jgi:UDP-N-acetylmuramate: L-alanyl-gamma-D-glutamyl-meso-diaminopimelate ligase
MHQYKGTLDKADIGIVYFNPHAVNLKKLPPINNTDVIRAFENERLLVFSDSGILINAIKSIKENKAAFLFMSSGNFNNTNIIGLSETMVKQ